MEHATPRWWVSPPGPDESLSSCLVRAATLYESEPSELWSQLHVGAQQPAGTVDDPSCPALQRMGLALGVPAPSLRSHRLPDSPALLAPQARMAICPNCWAEDDAAGRPRGYRRSWTHVLRTTCPVHQAPLILPRDRLNPDLATALAVQAALDEQDREILELIERFGATLEASLFEDALWPASWQGSPRSAREWLTRASFDHGSTKGPPLIANVSAPPALAGFIRGPRHYRELTGADGWEAFRHLVDPCERRAALWVVAWQMMPALPIRYSPGWIDMPGLL